MNKRPRSGVVILVCVFWFVPLLAQQPTAHPVTDWIRSGVVYEINPRTFSATGDFRGVEQRLDEPAATRGNDPLDHAYPPAGAVEQERHCRQCLRGERLLRDRSCLWYERRSQETDHGAHRRGLRVIIDIVANHTAWDSVLMKHPEFYKHDAKGNIISPQPDWSDVAGLDYTNQQLRAYMLDMLKYWLQEFDLDGFRCDVAGDVPTDFWESARAGLTQIKPDIIMIAEANKPELLLKAFDIDYAWPFHKTLTDVLENGTPATALIENWTQERKRYPPGTLEMRFSDDHDEKRAIVRFGERGALAASALVFTMDGVPLLYNGMEVGDTTESGAPALFEKLPVFWQISERRPNFRPTYQQLIALRKGHPALQQGETEWLQNSASSRILTFLRRGGGQEYFVAINISNQPFVGVVALPVGEYTDETPGVGDAAAAASVALPALSLGAWEFRIFRKVR